MMQQPDFTIKRDPRFIDLTGHRFGKLVVREIAPDHTTPDGHRRVQWLCQCDCGGLVTVLAHQLCRPNGTWSCKCVRNVSNGESDYKRGKMTSEWRTWSGLFERCYNPNHNSFHRYGGRGITVCDRWRESYKNFLEDMGRKPTPQHSIDRVDGNKGYEPLNCRWATKKEQGETKRNTVHITWKGETHDILEWQRITGIDRQVIWRRFRKKGWSSEQIFTTPVMDKGPKLTAEDACEIRREFAEGKLSRMEIAKKFGISYPNVVGIIQGRTWRRLEAAES